MSKNTTPTASDIEPKRLFNGPDEWAQTKTLIREHVERICLRYDDQEQTESLLLLLDLATNLEYDRLDRESIVTTARDHAFTFTSAFQTAQDVCFNKLPQGTELRMVA